MLGFSWPSAKLQLLKNYCVLWCLLAATFSILFGVNYFFRSWKKCHFVTYSSCWKNYPGSCSTLHYLHYSGLLVYYIFSISNISATYHITTDTFQYGL